jgi:hypothetical protein
MRGSENADPSCRSQLKDAPFAELVRTDADLAEARKAYADKPLRTTARCCGVGV